MAICSVSGISRYLLYHTADWVPLFEDTLQMSVVYFPCNGAARISSFRPMHPIHHQGIVGKMYRSTGTKDKHRVSRFSARVVFLTLPKTRININIQASKFPTGGKINCEAEIGVHFTVTVQPSRKTRRLFVRIYISFVSMPLTTDHTRGKPRIEIDDHHSFADFTLCIQRGPAMSSNSVWNKTK